MSTWMNRTKAAEAARIAAARERRQRAGNGIRCGFARVLATADLFALVKGSR